MTDDEFKAKFELDIRERISLLIDDNPELDEWEAAEKALTELKEWWDEDLAT
jgi:hypothetical protein